MKGVKADRTGTKPIVIDVNITDWSIIDRYATEIGSYAKNVIEDLVEQGAYCIKKEHPDMVKPKKKIEPIKFSLKPKKISKKTKKK
jgi:hypothetical protein